MVGAEAAIISTRRVAGGVELTAALDYQVQPSVAKPNPALEAELRKTQAQDSTGPCQFTSSARRFRG